MSGHTKNQILIQFNTKVTKRAENNIAVRQI
jgi:hypothetical protein